MPSGKDSSHRMSSKSGQIKTTSENGDFSVSSQIRQIVIVLRGWDLGYLQTHLASPVTAGCCFSWLLLLQSWGEEDGIKASWTKQSLMFLLRVSCFSQINTLCTVLNFLKICRFLKNLILTIFCHCSCFYRRADFWGPYFPFKKCFSSILLPLISLYLKWISYQQPIFTSVYKISTWKSSVLLLVCLNIYI